MSGGRLVRPPSTESLFAGAVALAGLALGLRPLADNSTFVHLRTGIDVVAGAGIPRHDPYSFTAGGEPWVVQSWLASASYGLAERAGEGVVVLLNAVLMGVTAWLIARLARTGSPVRTLGATVLALGVSAPLWSPRPLLFGLVCFTLLVVVVERRASPWWLVPVVWVWVNSHGSFPLGAVWLAVYAVGTSVDQRRRPVLLARYGAGLAAGLVVAALNPLGPRLLAFPLSVGERREQFRTIVEWQSPDFQSTEGLIVLGFLALALTVLLRAGVAWRHLLPVIVFLALGLFALRNLVLLGPVLAPALGHALRPRDPSPADNAAPPPLNRVMAAVLVAAALALGAHAVVNLGLDFRAYPVASVEWLEDRGRLEAPHRVASREMVGCYLILREGRGARVFVDDRVDMYPPELWDDYQDLLRGRPGALAVLDRRRVDAVLWEADGPLVALLDLDPGWRRGFAEDDWVVFVRRGPAGRASPAPALGTVG